MIGLQNEVTQKTSEDLQSVTNENLGGCGGGKLQKLSQSSENQGGGKVSRNRRGSITELPCMDSFTVLGTLFGAKNVQN